MNEDFYELETDESTNSRADKKVKTDEFRLCENRYGILREERPNQARNADELGIISLWTYSKQGGYHCYHSFYVEHPMCFKTRSEAHHINKTVLYVGRNRDVFFFHEKKQVTKRGMTSADHKELYMQIIKKDDIFVQGELARETSENCESFRIRD